MANSAAPIWTPSEDRRRQSHMAGFMARAGGFDDYAALHRWSIDDPQAFWRRLWDEADLIVSREPDAVIVADPVMRRTRFFDGAVLNVAENLLRADDDRPALIACSESAPELRTLSHRSLRRQSASLAQAWRAMGIAPGDRIAAILPNGPEAIVAALAAAAIGAVWSSCSPDFGTQALIDRFGQIEPRLLIACNGYRYGGEDFPIAQRIGDLPPNLPSVEALIAVQTLDDRPIDPPPGVALHAFADLTADDARHAFAPLPFDHPLCILYSSGTSGKPKCIVHRAGGALLTHIKEHRLHCDIHRGDRLFYFTTCGWMMWNWLFSVLASEAVAVLYDGHPLHPDPAMLFDLAAAAGVTHFGVSAKYIDALRKSGARPGDDRDLSGLKTMMSTGSPLAADNFDVVHDVVKADLHLISMSGGTDIMGCFVGGVPVQPVWRGALQGPILGMDAAVFDAEGKPTDAPGELVCRRPFPSMPLGFWKDDDQSAYRRAYFDRFDNVWAHGDFVQWRRRRDPSGGGDEGGLCLNMEIFGRSDATLNPSGVRIGPAELYAVVEAFDDILESVAVAQSWDGDVRIVLFVVLRPGAVLEGGLETAIRRAVRKALSPRHVPARIVAAADIPRTRSGKISEIAVRETIHGRPIGNRDALANPEALDLFVDLAALRR